MFLLSIYLYQQNLFLLNTARQSPQSTTMTLKSGVSGSRQNFFFVSGYLQQQQQQQAFRFGQGERYTIGWTSRWKPIQAASHRMKRKENVNLPCFFLPTTTATTSSSSSTLLKRYNSKEKYLPPKTDLLTNFAVSNAYSPPDEIKFEWQELRASLEVIREKDIPMRSINPDSIDKILKYVDTLIQHGSAYSKLQAPDLAGRWSLTFSTEEKYMLLPKGTKLFVDIYADKEDQNNYDKYTEEQKLEANQANNGGKRILTKQKPVPFNQILRFDNIFVDKLVAEGDYEYRENGDIIFDFRKTSFNFGFWKDLNLPLLFGGAPGSGNGQSSYVSVTYLDPAIWIEKHYDDSKQTYFYNIYERVSMPTETEEIFII